MRLLAIDTSSAQCSAALLIGGEVAVREQLTAREHARLLLPMIDSLLAEAATPLRGLDGIAFGRGPGSFTGVRIAAAVTQGLAAGADLPVLPVSSLRALAVQARRLAVARGALAEGQLLACLDARMGEVYWGAWQHDGREAAVERVCTPEALVAALQGPVAAAAGKGLAAYGCIAESLPGSAVFPDAEPHARDVAVVAASLLAGGAPWLDAAQAQPVYLRNDVVQAPRQPSAPGL